MSQDNTIANNIYQRIGGEPALRALVESFYQHMDTLDEASSIRAMHAKNLRVSVDKLFMFLSGFFGGPNAYVEKYGHPFLRRRHLPFAIGTDEAKQWLICMEKALAESAIDQSTADEMMSYFTRTALHMRNQPGDEPTDVLQARLQHISD